MPAVSHWAFEATDGRPRVCVGIPCYGDVPPDVLEDYMRFAFHLGRHLPQFNFFLGIRTKAEQFRARNQIVEAAQQMNCEWLLMLDDDMIINHVVTDGPTEAYGFVARLIAHDKDICGALYYQKGGACPPVLMTKQGERGYRFLRDDEVTHDLQRVDVAGGGCLLIRMTVFDHIAQPYFAPEFEFGTDVQLCRKAAEKGFEVWADTSIELGHLKPSRAIISSRNRHQFQLEDQVPGEVKRTFLSSSLYDDLLRDACQWTGYGDLEEMTVYAQGFHDAWVQHKASGASDADWYRRFPKERVARQVWFNLTVSYKRQMTDVILNSVRHTTPLSILDFGCGIGLPAFVFAEKGHDVMAVDIAGTGTFEFLQWRAKQHGVPITFGESRGGVYGLSGHRFDVIVAMDCLEHLPEWRRMLTELVTHLKPGGALFCNNAILDDPDHVEHYDLRPKAFQIAAAEENLVAVNQITYLKRADVPELAHA